MTVEERLARMRACYGAERLCAGIESVTTALNSCIHAIGACEQDVIGLNFRLTSSPERAARHLVHEYRMERHSIDASLPTELPGRCHVIDE